MTIFFFFFFNDTATTEIYTLSLHDALPIYLARRQRHVVRLLSGVVARRAPARDRSEEHTSELQSRVDLVCRLLIEKKKCASSATAFHLEWLYVASGMYEVVLALGMEKLYHNNK